MNAKSVVQELIRWGHCRFCSGKLPTKLGVYFHEIRQQDHATIASLVQHFRGLGYRFTGNPSEFVADQTGPIAFLSIDDNFRTSFELLELAKEWEFHFCLYLNTLHFRDSGTPDSRIEYLANLRDHSAGDDAELLSQDEVRAIAEAGHTIGAHTRTHRQLTLLPVAEAQEEIRSNKLDLEAILGQPIKHFSYPFGMRRHFSEPLRHYCLEIGFETVANAIPGLLYDFQTPEVIQRTGWDLHQSIDRNVENLCIDGRKFEKITGRSAVV